MAETHAQQPKTGTVVFHLQRDTVVASGLPPILGEAGKS